MATRQYIGARYVPKFATPTEWNSGLSYEGLTIVTHLGNSFTSKKPVPAGIDIANTEYWANTGNYNAQVEEYRQEVEKIKTKFANTVSVLDFGAVDDLSVDSTQSFIDAISYCEDNNTTLIVPRTTKGFKLTRTLNFNKPINVICDPLTVMNWDKCAEHPADVYSNSINNSRAYTYGVGINIDYGDAGVLGGYYRFGVLGGDESYTAEGADLPSGKYWTAVRVANGDMAKIIATYLHHWNRGFLIESVSDSTMDNEIEFQNCDLCLTGIEFVSGNYGITGTVVNCHTVGLCQNGIVLKPTGTGYIGPNTINIFDLYVETPGGSAIYSDTTINKNINGNKFNVARIEARTTPFSKIYYGITENFKSPFISGNANHGGESTFFDGDLNMFNCGMYESDPVAGDPIRIMCSGTANILYNNRMYQTGFLGSTITPSDTKGESNFKGGVGSALMCNKGVFRITMPEHSAGDVTSFYVYSQLLDCWFSSPIAVIPMSSYEKDFKVTAIQNATVNREVEIIVTNINGNSAGYTLDFALDFSQK